MVFRSGWMRKLLNLTKESKRGCNRLTDGLKKKRRTQEEENVEMKAYLIGNEITRTDKLVKEVIYDQISGIQNWTVREANQIGQVIRTEEAKALTFGEKCLNEADSRSTECGSL
jgi:hypothetical protein